MSKSTAPPSAHYRIADWSHLRERRACTRAEGARFLREQYGAGIGRQRMDAAAGHGGALSEETIIKLGHKTHDAIETARSIDRVTMTRPYGSGIGCIASCQKMKTA
jgi:hypothetical protein